MKLSKPFHVLSVVLGLAGLVAWALAIFASPGGGVMFGQTREVMLMCAMLALLTAVWLEVGAMHHITLERTGETI